MYMYGYIHMRMYVCMHTRIHVWLRLCTHRCQTYFMNSLSFTHTVVALIIGPVFWGILLLSILKTAKPQYSMKPWYKPYSIPRHENYIKPL